MLGELFSKDMGEESALTPLPDVLAAFTEVSPSEDDKEGLTPPGLHYTYSHLDIPNEERPFLKKFLRANMDELRLFYAERYADAVLGMTEHDDAMYFRHGVLRRELSGDMDYEKQRDHASHTLNNYLFGWYLFCHSDRLADNMRAHLERRFPESKRSLFQEFGNIWPIASLLHDVGYIFEGGLRSLDTNAAVSKARKGAEYVQDFFQSLFWEDIGLCPTDLREEVEKLTEVTTPQIGGGSLAQISDSLRRLGSLDVLFEALIKERPEFAHLIANSGADRPLGDAFFLCETNYRCFDQPTMAMRVKDLEAAHTQMLRDGLPRLGVRVLDHGIAGGMLLLLHSTLYYRVHFGMLASVPSLGSKAPAEPDAQEPSPIDRPGLSVNAELVRRMHHLFDGVSYEASWWWGAIVWATAAVAIHNVQTMDPWPGSPGADRLLRLAEDPLAYLGILVDVLQEWDRYTTSRNSVFTGELPVSSTDINIGVSNGVVHINYGTGQVAEKAARKVKEVLGKSLDGWEDIVRVSYST